MLNLIAVFIGSFFAFFCLLSSTYYVPSISAGFAASFCLMIVLVSGKVISFHYRELGDVVALYERFFLPFSAVALPFSLTVINLSEEESYGGWAILAVVFLFMSDFRGSIRSYVGRAAPLNGIDRAILGLSASRTTGNFLSSVVMWALFCGLAFLAFEFLSSRYMRLPG